MFKYVLNLFLKLNMCKMQKLLNEFIWCSKRLLLKRGFKGRYAY